MSTHPIAWLENGTPAKSKAPTARIAFGAPRARRRRMGWRRPDQPGGISGKGVLDRISIEESVARIIADNAPQLYRSGA